jgi:Na+/H+-dicarboxylate symporter
MSQTTRILLALIAGLLLGIGAAALTPYVVKLIAPVLPMLAKLIAPAMAFIASVMGSIGSAWLHGLQMVIVPLILGLLVIGVGATADAVRAGRIALRAVLTFVAILWSTTLMSAALMPALLKLWPLPPSSAAALRAALPTAPPSGTVPTIADFFDKIVPANAVAAAANDAFLPLTIFALAFAFAVTQLAPEPRERITGLFSALTDAMLVIIGWLLKLAPIGVFALAYSVGVHTGAAAIGALLHYIILVSTIGFLVLLAAYPVGVIGGRVPLGRFARTVAPAQAVALSTQSSLASLPAMLVASESLGSPPTVAGIILPMAVSIFRATSPAMNLAVALYVAHWLGVPIGPGQLAFGIATAAITTMGSVSLPGTISFFASVVPVAVAMGVPIAPLGLLIAVETIPDLFRTVGNVTMDTAVATLWGRRLAEAEAPLLGHD